LYTFKKPLSKFAFSLDIAASIFDFDQSVRSLSLISPAWLERDIKTSDAATYQNYKTYSYGLISSGGDLIDSESDDNGTSYTKYTWSFNTNWNQWNKMEEKAIMIIYASGMLFILISLWNITVTECVAIKSQGTMLIMMVVWNILAALCLTAAIIMFCATWHTNSTLNSFCKNPSDSGTKFAAFSLGICQLSWAIYGAVATACVIIFLTGLNIIAAYKAKNQRRDAAFRHM